MTAQAWLLVAAVVGAYMLSCLIWPWKACSRCSGGRKRAEQAKVWRDCGRCGGSGRRRRFGRWLIDVVTGR